MSKDKLIGEIDGLLERVENEGMDKDKVAKCLKSISELAHEVRDTKEEAPALSLDEAMAEITPRIFFWGQKKINDEELLKDIRAILTKYRGGDVSVLEKVKELLDKRCCPLDESSENPDESVCGCPTCVEFREGVQIIEDAIDEIKKHSKGG